jgi:hypothetical protein
MNKEKQKFLFYQLNPLKRLKEQKPKDKGIKEKHIENLFCQNLENIFCGWIPLSQQQYLEHPDKSEENCIVDSLAFDRNRENFLIIEYKKERAAELVYQVEKYMECLEDEERGVCIRNRNKLVDILNNNESLKKTKGIWKEEKIKWDETKAICITTEIHGYQKILKRKPRKNIHVLEIKFYEENFLSVDCEKLPDWLKIGSQITTKPAPNLSFETKATNNWNLSKVIQEWRPNPEIEKILLDFDGWVSEIFDSDIPPCGYWINYFWKGYSRPVLFSLVPGKTQIRVYWGFKEVEKISENLSSMLGKYDLEYSEKSHYGRGKWFFPPIKNDSNLQKLKEFIQEYKNYYGDKPRLD